MPDKSPKEQRVSLKEQLDTHDSNDSKRKIYSRMTYPSPPGFSSVGLSSEQIEKDQELSDERRNQILQSISDTGLEVNLEDKNVIQQSFNENTLSANNSFQPQDSKVQLKDAFDMNAFRGVQPSEEIQSRMDEFNHTNTLQNDIEKGDSGPERE